MSGSWLDEQVAKAMSDRREKHTVIKLPCCGTRVELTSKGDQFIKCPNCHHDNAVTWGLDPKVKTQLGDNHEPNINCTCDNCLRHFNR